MISGFSLPLSRDPGRACAFVFVCARRWLMRSLPSQVNPQLYSMREKQQLVELVDTMLSYNLTYRQDRSPEGQYMYLLEP